MKKFDAETARYLTLIRKNSDAKKASDRQKEIDKAIEEQKTKIIEKLYSLIHENATLGYNEFSVAPTHVGWLNSLFQEEIGKLVEDLVYEFTDQGFIFKYTKANVTKYNEFSDKIQIKW